MPLGMRTASGTAAAQTALTGLDQSGANFSAGMWVRTIGTSSGPVLWGHVNDSDINLDGIQLRIDYPNIGIRVCDATTVSTVVSTGLFASAEREWVHLGWRYDGARIRFYRNGLLGSSAALTRVPTANGTRRTSLLSTITHREYFDIRIFPNVALNDAEMRALTDPRRDVAGCKGRWFREWVPGASVTVPDESGSGNHLITSATLSQCQSTEPPPWRQMIW